MATVEDMGDAIAFIGTAEHNVRRFAGPNYVNGRASPAAATVIKVQAIPALPLSGKQLDRLPENLRTHETRQMFTTTQLKTAGAGQQPDEVEAEGVWWQVQSVEAWNTLAGYYRVILTRVGH